MKRTKLIVNAIIAIVSITLFFSVIHLNDVQNLMIIQNLNGSVEVRRDGGWFLRIFPRKWVYPKASVEICNEKDKDAIKMQFSNKTTASLACQIGYRIDSTNDEQIIRLHQLVEGQDDKIWKIVQTSLQTAAQRVASQYTPSESVEKFDEFQQKIVKAILHTPDLLEKGIDVVSFTCAGLPEYDPETKAQFAKQKEADLAKRLAEAEKIKLEAEKLKVEAEFQRQIAQQKGEAEAQMAKDVQSKEREKKMAEIEASKAVEVAKLEKERAVIEVERQKEVAKVEAEREFVVAEVKKRTEAENLEAVKLKAEQKIAEARAKKEAIALAGEITEAERVKLEIEKEMKIGIAEQQAKTYAHWNPQVIQVSGGTTGGSVGSTTTALENFLNMNAAKAAIDIAGGTAAATK